MVITLTRWIDRIPIACLAICATITILIAATTKWRVFSTNARWLAYDYVVRIPVAAKFLIIANINARCSDLPIIRRAILADANARCADLSYS